MEGAARDRSFKVLDEGLEVEFLAAEVAVHEGLVLALGDDPLDEPVAGLRQPGLLRGVGVAVGALAGGVVVDALGEQAGQAGDGRVAVGALGAVQGQVEGEYGLGGVAAEDLAADLRQFVEVGPRRLQVGDDDRAGHADRRALVPHHAGRPGQRLGAVGGRDDEKGRVRCPQTGPELPDEIGVSGSVQQIDLDTAPFHRYERELYRALLAVLDVVVVGDRGPLGDMPGAVHRPGGQGQRLDQRCLSGAAVADQHHVSNLLWPAGLAGRRCPSGGSWICPVG